jgi:recombination protein RecA
LTPAGIYIYYFLAYNQITKLIMKSALPLNQQSAIIKHHPIDWSLSALSGLLTEVSGGDDSAALTLVAQLVFDCQESSQPAAWITTADSAFYPPDFAAAGINLDALTVVRLSARHAAFIAAEHLLRSGAFGLIVIDRGSDSIIPAAFQRRLQILARHHDIAAVCLTDKSPDADSAGALINVHAVSRRTQSADSTVCEVVFKKVKGGQPGKKLSLVISRSTWELDIGC